MKLDRAIRRVRESARLRRAAAALGAAYVRLVLRTTRWRIEGAETRDLVRSGHGRWIILAWHGRVLMLPTENTAQIEIHAMISANRDGDMIADLVGRFGVPAIRGSARDPRKADRDKGGRAVAMAAMRLMAGKDAAMLAITPDGPRGPRMRMQPGVAVLSALTGAPAAPFAWATRRAIVAPSWDRFMIPLPFGTGVKVYGPPIDPPERRDSASLEAHRLALEAALNAVTARADEIMGRAPMHPAKALAPVHAAPAAPGRAEPAP